MKRKLYLAAWWAYLALLVVVVIVKFRGSFQELAARMSENAFGFNYNLVPFRTVGEQLAQFSEGWARFNFFGNILPFLPFGFLLPLAYPKAGSLPRVLAAGFLFLLVAEAFQYCTGLGSFDVDDLLLNELGLLLGYCLLLLARRLPKREG